MVAAPIVGRARGLQFRTMAAWWLRVAIRCVWRAATFFGVFGLRACSLRANLVFCRLLPGWCRGVAGKVGVALSYNFTLIINALMEFPKVIS
jgi:hypothetical protein